MDKSERIDIKLSLFGKEDMMLQLKPLSGKVLALMCMAVACSFLVSLYVDMTSTMNDVYKSSTIPNDMSLDLIEGIEPVEEVGSKNNTIISNGNIELNQMNFMPYYKIVTGKLFDRKEFDVFDSNNNIDYDKLSTYV